MCFQYTFSWDYLCFSCFELSLQAIERQMVKEIYRVAVTLRSVEEFYVSLFSGNKEKDRIQKARFLKIECDAL